MIGAEWFFIVSNVLPSFIANKKDENPETNLEMSTEFKLKSTITFNAYEKVTPEFFFIYLDTEKKVSLSLLK